MLVLSRKLEESIYIGDALIKVQVLGVKGRQVKLGIEAPKEVNIHRKEVFERIQAQKKVKKEVSKKAVAE